MCATSARARAIWRTVPLDDAMEREGAFADPRGSPEHWAVGRRDATRRLRGGIEKLAGGATLNVCCCERPV